MKTFEGSLESLRERFGREFPGREVVATYVDRIVWRDKGAGLYRETKVLGSGWGDTEIVEQTEAHSEFKATALHVVDGYLSGGDVSTLIEDLVAKALSGASVGLGSTYAGLSARVSRRTQWRSYYNDNESRLVRALTNFGVAESVSMPQKFVGESPTVPEVVNSMANLLRWLTEKRAELELVEFPVGCCEVGLAKDLEDLQALRIDLANEISSVVYTIRGIEVSEANVGDAALIYDLIAAETVRYEKMRAFVARACQVVKV